MEEPWLNCWRATSANVNRSTHAIAEAVCENGGIDVLINDAGIIQVGPVEHLTLEDFEDAMATHFWGPLYAILAARPHLHESTAARIVNISSIGGKVAAPHLLPYTASKFALTGLSEGLSAELAREGIHVTTVCPGLMRTGSTYNAWFKGNHRQRVCVVSPRRFAAGTVDRCRRAARQMIEACRQGDPELVITLPARLGVLMNAVFPNAVARAMRLVNALLPAPRTGRPHRSRDQGGRVSRRLPRRYSLDGPTEATRENNEMPQQGRRHTPNWLGTRDSGFGSRNSRFG